MELNLKDRIAVVTGGAEGIGKAIAKGLAAEGCAIWILDRNGGAAESAAAAIGAKAATLDVSDAAAVAQVFQNLGRLDILVNAAGVLSTGLVADLPVTEWQRVSEVNIAGVLYCVKAAMPTLRKQHYGRIINLASVSALRGGGCRLDDGTGARAWRGWDHRQCYRSGCCRHCHDACRAHR